MVTLPSSGSFYLDHQSYFHLLARGCEVNDEKLAPDLQSFTSSFFKCCKLRFVALRFAAADLMLRSVSATLLPSEGPRVLCATRSSQSSSTVFLSFYAYSTVFSLCFRNQSLKFCSLHSVTFFNHSVVQDIFLLKKLVSIIFLCTSSAAPALRVLCSSSLSNFLRVCRRIPACPIKVALFPV